MKKIIRIVLLVVAVALIVAGLWPIIMGGAGAAGVFNVRLGFLVPGIILLTLLPFVSIIPESQKQARKGPLVIGELLSFQQTGLRVNDQPQIALTVKFKTQDGQAVTGTGKRVILLTDLSQFQPGMPLPIRYNPKKPEEIWIDLQADKDQGDVKQAVDKYLNARQEAFTQNLLATGQLTQERLDIAKNGVKAKGVIIKTTPTGKIVNENAEIELRIAVTRPDGSSYETTITRAPTQMMMANLFPGSVIDVAYMPHDEQNIAMSFTIDNP